MIEIVKRLYKKIATFVAVALLLFLSVDRCYRLCTRRPSRAAQGHRPYDMSPCALFDGIKAGVFKVV